MKSEYQTIESELKRSHRIGWTPTFKLQGKTKLKAETSIGLSLRVFEELGWDLVYYDDKTAEAKRKNDWGTWTELIKVTSSFGKLEIQSSTLGNGFWDLGRNSKRAKLFLAVYNQLYESMSEEELLEFENQVKRKNNLDDYEIPESLPQPPKAVSPKFWVIIIGFFFLSVILAFLFAFLSKNVVYIIAAYELGVGLALGLGFRYLIKLSNFTEYEKLNYILTGSVILIYFLNQYFIFQLFRFQEGLDISFWNFFTIRFNHGLTIKTLETGSIGLVINWIFQLAFTWFIANLRMIIGLTTYQIERVPVEVSDFVYYLFFKEKSEQTVRNELASRGWKSKSCQDEAIQAVAALGSATEINRTE